MTTTTDIINALGADTVQRICEVGEFSLRAARRDGQFPASWFDAIDRACAEQGIHCPRSLFAFKRPDIFDHPPAHGPSPDRDQPRATPKRSGDEAAAIGEGE